jgi:hypothetical protein
MPKISRVAIFQVDLIPEVLLSDAIQAFSQTRNPDGSDLDGRRCGRHGAPVTRSAPADPRSSLCSETTWRLGDSVATLRWWRKLWKGLFFYTHANSVGREPWLRGRGHCETVGSQSGNKDVALETLV